MDYEIENLWSEDTDMNIVKTWLLNGTFGGTHTVTGRFLSRISVDESKYDYDYCRIEVPVDEIIGWKHDYKLDDPGLEVRAKEIVDGLNEFAKEVNAHPENYFSLTRDELLRRGMNQCGMCAHRDACLANKPNFRDADPACGAFKLG